jgi:hypothetical protein
MYATYSEIYLEWLSLHDAMYSSVCTLRYSIHRDRVCRYGDFINIICFDCAVIVNNLKVTPLILFAAILSESSTMQYNSVHADLSSDVMKLF